MTALSYDVDGVAINPAPYTLVQLAARAGQRYGRKLARLKFVLDFRELDEMTNCASGGWLPEQVDGLTKESLAEAGIAFWRASRQAMGWDV